MPTCALCGQESENLVTFTSAAVEPRAENTAEEPPKLVVCQRCKHLVMQQLIGRIQVPPPACASGNGRPTDTAS
jgi:hypothetical protein